MKRVIIDLLDDYADCLSVTATGIRQVGSETVLNVHTYSMDIHNGKDEVHYVQAYGSNGVLFEREEEE